MSWWQSFYRAGRSGKWVLLTSHSQMVMVLGVKRPMPTPCSALLPIQLGGPFSRS